MKKGIHPENYRPVVFKDMSNGDMFLSKSTAKTDQRHSGIRRRNLPRGKSRNLQLISPVLHW